jgi:hypothetical protein
MDIYIIRNKQTKMPIRVSSFSNAGGEFCNEVGAEFKMDVEDDYAVYAVTSYGTALRALEQDPDWYNSSLERPEWPANFDPGAWEIHSVKI